MIQCGICKPPYTARRDYMKATHFPTKHPGQAYLEKGERTLSFNVSVAPQSSHVQPFTIGSDSLSDEILDDVVVANTAGAVERVAADKNLDVVGESDKVGVSNEDLMELIVKMQKTMDDQLKKNQSSAASSASDNDERLLVIQGSKSIDELCLRAGMTPFEREKKIICDICTHDDLTDDFARKLGEFRYDQFEYGDDFTNRSESREFRNLKTIVVKHFKSQYHMKMSNDLVEKHKKDEVNEVYNTKVGMGRARQIYENVKNKCSYEKYESDCLVSSLNGEDVGNCNHSFNFAKNIVKEASLVIQERQKSYFKNPLLCTGKLPPVGLSTDKMSPKRHTNHLSAFLTPDVDAPLADSLLKPVFIGMPIVDKHGGKEIAEQMIKVAESYLADLGEQLQAFNNDGQYFGLNIKKHVFEQRKELELREEFLLFNWDPAHRNALGDKDARDESSGIKFFNDTLLTIQWIFKHVGYGKHYEEYLVLCKDLNIDPRAPITFSDTRFPQFSYNTLRNFLQVYVGLMHQMDAEDTLKNGKDEALNSALKKIKTKAFAVTVAGATDIYRREQILSQQCQKIDQHIYEVYDNLKMQTDKLEEMLEDLTKGTPIKDWTEADVDKLDEHLWANLKVTLKDIFVTGKFRGEEMDDFPTRTRITRQSLMDEHVTKEGGGECSPGIVKGLEQVKKYNKKLVEALKERFESDFADPFIVDIKDVLDFNFMLDLENSLEENTETYQGCIEIVRNHGIEALDRILERQHKIESPSEKEKSDIMEQYNSFKEYAFDLIAGVDIAKEKKAIKAVAIVETAVCLECHRRFEMPIALKKHAETAHKQKETIRCQDPVRAYSSIKVLHGVCQQEKLYSDKKDFVALALKLLCKTPNEAIVESIGSVLLLHMKPQRNARQVTFEHELHIDWNGPVVSRADEILAKSLDRHFGSRKKWNFKSGESKFFSSKVIDRQKVEKSRLSFMNKL